MPYTLKLHFFPLAAAKIPSSPQKIAVTARAVFLSLLGPWSAVLEVCGSSCLMCMDTPAVPCHQGPVTLSHSNNLLNHYLCKDGKRSVCIFLWSFLHKSYITLACIWLILFPSSWSPFWHVQGQTVQMHKQGILWLLCVSNFMSPSRACVSLHH